MIEELKVIVELFANLGVMALWGAAGYAIFKLVTLASYMALATYIARRFWDYLDKKKNDAQIFITEYNLDKHIIKCEEGNGQMLATVLLGLRSKELTYIHRSDIEWLADAIAEKRARDGKDEYVLAK